ncbi:MAG: hypothetical protein IJR84_09185 [Bacteroidaceae bacterium]|nr:hypothetical protein [Bacteroidaceae bacterium]
MIDTFGLKKIWVKALASFGSPTIGSGFWANANAAANSAADGWKDLGDVFQNTAKLSEEEQSKETFKSETSTRKIVIYGKPGDATIELELMSPDLDLLARYFGGTVVTDNTTNKKSWERPSNFTAKPFAMMVLAENGLMLKCAQVSIAPRLEMDYSETGVFRVPMKISLVDPVIYDENDTSPIFVAA